jgi:hypothetical protein
VPLNPEYEAALVRENQSLREQMIELGRVDKQFRDHQMELLQALMMERDRARGINKQAFTLLWRILSLVRDEAAALRCRTLHQYRSRLIGEISSGIREAINPNSREPIEVQARVTDDGSHVAIGFLNAHGRMQEMKPLTVDRARVLVAQIEESITAVVSHEAEAAFGGRR